MGALSDNELLKRIHSGDTHAFNQLLERYYQTIYAFAYKYCHSQQDAEDITQEALIKIAASIQSFNHRSKLTTWLYRVTINTAKDHLKKELTRNKYHNEYSQKVDSNDKSKGSGENRNTDLWDLIKKLPSNQYQAMILVYGEGLSHQEAGQVLGCAATTVSWRVFKAKKYLRKRAETLHILIVFIFIMSWKS